MVDDSFVPSSKQPSVICCRLTDFMTACYWWQGLESQSALMAHWRLLETVYERFIILFNNNSQYITINYQSEAFENNLNSKKKPHSLLVFSLPICSRPKTKNQKLIQETYLRNLFKKISNLFLGQHQAVCNITQA